MVITGLLILRAGFRLAWISTVFALLTLIALPHVLSVLSWQMYIVRGASMEPSISLGSVVLIEPADPTQVHPGDIVTFRAGANNVVTHRVIAVSGGSQLAFATKGDANTSADPVTVPADAIVGRVGYSVPVLGFVLNTLASTAGVVIILGILGTLLLGGWFIEELAATLGPSAERGTVAEPAI